MRLEGNFTTKRDFSGRPGIIQETQAFRCAYMVESQVTDMTESFTRQKAIKPKLSDGFVWYIVLCKS